MRRLVPSSALTVTLPLLLCAVVAVPVSYADTEAIKLTCDLDVTTQSADGAVKQSHETAVVVMLFDAATGFRAITIHSVAIPVAVANKKGGAVTSFVDNSDESRWDISNRRDRSKVASEESATIDRSTGHFTAYSTTTVGDASQHVEARGSCATIDTGKRKFQAQVSPARGTAVSASTLQPASQRAGPYLQICRSCTRVRSDESILRFLAMTVNAKRRSHERV